MRCRRFLSPGVIGAGLVLAAGSLAGPARAGEGPIPLRFSSIANASQSYIPAVMIERGIDKKYGLAVQLIPLSTPAQQWTSLRSGDADVSSGSFLDLLRQRQAGLKVKAFRAFYTFGNPIVAPPDKPFHKLSDLRGVPVGVPSAILLDWMILRAAGRKAEGFDIGKDARVVEAAPQLLMQQLLRGQLAASYMFADFVLQPIVEGKLREVTTVRKVMTEAGLDTRAFYLIYTVADAWRAKHGPEAVGRLVAAMDEAAEVMDKDDGVWPALAKRSGVEDPKLLPEFVKMQRARFKVEYSRAQVEPTQRLLDEMLKTAGQEAMGVTRVDPDAFDLDSVEAAKKLRR
jgi:ABC-type nitrate/sulfonate/bicarbonate transport system substrate-binding protein